MNVLNTDLVTRSYITLFDRDSNPDVRRTGHCYAIGNRIGEVGRRRAAQRAVGHADAAPPERVVDHLVDFHDVARVRPGLIADDDGEHDAVVGVPRTSRGVGDRRVVERWDAAPRARAGVAELTVVDQHPAPAPDAPVDLGIGVIEERLPTRLDQREQPLLIVVVAVEGGQIPRE